MTARLAALVVALLVWAMPTAAQGVPANGLGQVPQLFIGTWYQTGPTDVTETKFKQLVDAAAAKGLAQYGYYIILEGPFTLNRVGGILTPDPSEFPSGIAAMGTYVHSKGFKFGIYGTPAALNRCGGGAVVHMDGSYQHETTDANTFASWGADLLEYDWCGAENEYGTSPSAVEGAFSIMGNALLATGRPMYYMIHTYGLYDGPNWFAATGANQAEVNVNAVAMWNYTGTNSYYVGVSGMFDYPWNATKTVPGHQQYGDQIMVGCSVTNSICGGDLGTGFTLTTDEAKSQLGMFALMSSPWLLGTDIVNASDTTMSLITNTEVIAILQDPLVSQARASQVTACGSSNCYVYVKAMSGGRYAVGLFNRDDSSHTVSAPLTGLGCQVCRLRDAWAKSDVGYFSASDTYSATVPAHGMVLLTVTNSGTAMQNLTLQNATVR